MGHVPTTNLDALYANTTAGTVADPAKMDAAIQDIVATVDGNYDAAQPVDSTLTALAAYNTNGLMTQTAADTFTGRTITGTTNRITVTNGSGVSGNPTLDIGSDVVTLTGAQTLTNKSISADQIGTGSVSNTEYGYLDGVTSAIQTQFSNKQPLDSTLTALASYNTNGILTQTAADTFTGRTITGTTNRISVTNGSGVSGNPTLDIGSDVVTLTGSQTLTDKSITGTFIGNLTGNVTGNLTGNADTVTTNANLTGDVTSVGNVTTLSTTGVSAGTYKSVTVDTKGRVSAGTNPTTLSGYDITDAAPLSHVGAGGSAHAEASSSSAGFMSTAMYDKLNGISSTGLNSFTVPADTALTFGGRFKIIYTTATDTLDIYET